MQEPNSFWKKYVSEAIFWQKVSKSELFPLFLVSFCHYEFFVFDGIADSGLYIVFRLKTAVRNTIVVQKRQNFLRGRCPLKPRAGGLECPPHANSKILHAARTIRLASLVTHCQEHKFYFVILSQSPVAILSNRDTNGHSNFITRR